MKTVYLSKKDLDLLCEWESGSRYGKNPLEFFMAELCRIPTKGLKALYLDIEPKWVRYGGAIYYHELEFCYGNDIHFSVRVIASEKINLEQFIQKYDDNIKIYMHEKMKESSFLFCPFQKLRAEELFVEKEILEKLTTLCSGSFLWKLSVKSRYKWNGNMEVEFTLLGTTLTWLIWVVWFCLSVSLFFYTCIQSVLIGLLVLLGAGLYHYLFFIRSARKITEEAKAVFNEAIFSRNS